MLSLTEQLNSDQKAALKALQGRENIFVTGAAGSGKSFLMRAYLRERRIPILASTGAAAILVGGRTFHSFFGLGILEGGVPQTVTRALANTRLVKRLSNTETVVIDEISMIAGPVLMAAETIARKARGNTTPWGGLRVIAVGDFSQLPPVNPFSQEKPWAFLHDVWRNSAFQPVMLTQSMRARDPEFLAVLNEIRLGRVAPSVRRFLDSRVDPAPQGELTRLFSRRDSVERYNLARLEVIPGAVHSFTTIYEGKEKDVETFRKHSPLSDVIHLKLGARVMLRQNDPEGRWVNGTVGLLREISEESISIEIEPKGGHRATVEVPRAEFKLLDAEGTPVVTARNFPVTLAWAMTIHKAQGTTLDRMRVDLRGLWEPGQAYVALSRARDPMGLFIEGWNSAAIFTDPAVTEFHASLLNSTTPCTPRS